MVTPALLYSACAPYCDPSIFGPWPFCEYLSHWCRGLAVLVACVSCDDRTPEAGAHERGWRWGTFSEAGAAWLCPDCQEGPEVLW
jgi:hypothetical protein